MRGPEFPEDFEPIVLLHDVEGPVNLGCVCRAMANTGCHHLRWTGSLTSANPTARKYALHATPILDQGQSCADFDTMLGGIDLVVGFSPRDPWDDGRGLDLDGCLNRISRAVASAKSVGLLFGNEAHGLDNHALAACHFRAALPSCEEYVSLNLAQAVMVVLWEIHRRRRLGVRWPCRKPPDRSSPEEKRVFLDRLRQYLDHLEYFNMQNPELIWREIAGLFRRRDWTKRELNLLMSIIHKGQSRYLWALRRSDKRR